MKALLKNKNIQDSIIFFLLSVALSVYGFSSHYSITIEWEMSPYLFPVLISCFIMLLSISLFFDGYKQVKASIEVTLVTQSNLKGAFIVVAMTILYYILMPILSFVIATIIYLICMFVFLGEKSWWLIIILSVATSGIIQFLFGNLLNVLLP